MSKSDTGRLGEDIATEYIRKRGFRVIERNFREKWGELDIIAISPDRTLVFIEVKTIEYMSPDFDSKNLSLVSPEENLTHSKLNKLQRTASLYTGTHPELIKENRGWRIDLVAVRMFAGKHRVDHFENI